MTKEMCPNCIEPLKKETRVLGKIKKWLVCTICGYRTRDVDPDFHDNNQEARALIDRIKFRNEAQLKYK